MSIPLPQAVDLLHLGLRDVSATGFVDDRATTYASRLSDCSIADVTLAARSSAGAGSRSPTDSVATTAMGRDSSPLCLSYFHKSSRKYPKAIWYCPLGFAIFEMPAWAVGTVEPRFLGRSTLGSSPRMNINERGYNTPFCIILSHCQPIPTQNYPLLVVDS